MIETVKRQMTVHFTPNIDRLTEGLTVYIKRPAVVGWGLTCPSIQLAASSVLQLSAKTFFSVIPAMDDAAPQSLYSSV